ncbi:MAG: exonuclease subunit SbcD [Endozoicomonas sp.]
MRILHTSDWHLGQHFMGKSREAEHRAFLQWLRETVAEQEVDAVIVAGDIFDTGTPPSYARTLYNQFIVDLQQTCCRRLVVVGGNHDSVATLNESREVLACLNTTVIGGPADNLDEQVVVLKDKHGKPGAVVCAIPFIRPRDVLESRAGESDTDKQQALQNAIAGHYRAVFDKASEHGLPVVATGHLTTVGGQMTESVREIYIGTLSAFPASAFPPADYIALGHLHRPQKVSDQDHIRYSGSPIPLSFDETSTSKQVLLADFVDGKLAEVTSVEVPQFRPLFSLKGSLTAIEEQLQGIETGDGLTPWLEIAVSTDDYLSDLQSRVHELVEDKVVEVLRVRRMRENKARGLSRESTETLDELDVSDVFSRRLAAETLEDDKVLALTQAFNEILDQWGQNLDSDSIDPQAKNDPQAKKEVEA